MIYHGMNEDDVQQIMREPFTMIASDSGVRQQDESVPHPRGYGNKMTGARPGVALRGLAHAVDVASN